MALDEDNRVWGPPHKRSGHGAVMMTRHAAAPLMVALAIATSACGDSSSSTPVATTATALAATSTVAATAVGADDLAGLRIQEGAFDPAAGTSRFDPLSIVRSSAGDWHEVETSSGLVVPVPSGWVTFEIEDLEETYIHFAADGDPLEGEPTVFMRLWLDYGYDGDVSFAVSEWAEILSSFADRWESSKTVDGLWDYAAAEFTPSDLDLEEFGMLLGLLYPAAPVGSAVVVVVAAGGDPFAETVYIVSAAMARSDWDNYYPIVREMIERTATTGGVSLEVDLQAKLSFVD